MIFKSFCARVQLSRKYLIATANYVHNSCRITPISSYSHCSTHRVSSQPFLTNITCHKCQVQCYSRSILDGDPLDLQNAQKERELKNLSAIFPSPRVTLNELAAKSPDSVFDIKYKQASVAPKGTRKKVVQNDWTCTYTFVWPQNIKFESTAKSKRQAAEKAAFQALHWLHMNKRIDNKGYPIFDKCVIEELRNSLQEPIKASISDNSMDRISSIWEDYENGIKDMYTATFEAAARRVIAAPAALTKDSTIDEQDVISEDADSSNAADIVTESKISVHPVYGRHISPPTETALGRRKRQLVKTFQVYDEERTQLPIDEYSWNVTYVMEQFRMVTKNNNQANEKFMARESIVLLPILCLMVLRGVGSSVDQERFYGHVEVGQLSNAFNYYYLMQTFAVVLGMMLVPFFSEIHGRKPVFILLFTLALLSSIFSYVPYQKPWPTLGNFIVATLKGGVLTMSALAICEYCSPKHRFAWLVANEEIRQLSVNVTSMLYGQSVLSKESSYVSLCEVLVAVVCLVCLYWWPESPYWLASQGKKEESRAALLWLRWESDAARAELTALETARRRPSPKLFWLSILISILAVTVAKCAASEQQILTRVNQDLETVKLELSHRITIVCANVVISILLVVISYKVKRKFLYLTAAIIPLVLVYTLSIWLCAKQVENQKEAFYITTLICNSLLESGPFNLNLILFIEVVPQKYYTYMSCISSMFFYGTSLAFPIYNVVYSDSFPLYGSLLVFATLSLVASGVFYGLSEETLNKNVLEIENKYLIRLYHDNHNHELVQVVELEDDSRL